MSSTNKTDFLSLNNWLPTDKPKREDYNTDNLIIDEAVKQHFTNESIHTSTEEKNRWNNPIYVGVYFGNGTLEREITNDCDFIPQAAIVFACDKCPSRLDASNGKKYNYFAFATDIGSTRGFHLSGSDSSFTITQDVTPVQGSEFNYLNEVGTAYTYILFR